MFPYFCLLLFFFFPSLVHPHNHKQPHFHFSLTHTRTHTPSHSHSYIKPWPLKHPTLATSRTCPRISMCRRTMCSLASTSLLALSFLLTSSPACPSTTHPTCKLLSLSSILGDRLLGRDHPQRTLFRWLTRFSLFVSLLLRP